MDIFHWIGLRSDLLGPTLPKILSNLSRTVLPFLGVLQNPFWRSRNIEIHIIPASRFDHAFAVAHLVQSKKVERSADYRVHAGKKSTSEVILVPIVSSFLHNVDLQKLESLCFCRTVIRILGSYFLHSVGAGNFCGRPIRFKTLEIPMLCNIQA